MTATKATKKTAAPKGTKAAKPAPAKKAEGELATDQAPQKQLNVEETKKVDPIATKKNKAKPKAISDKAKKLSAIDAAAQILASAKEPMTSKELIESMASKGLWTSPGGKTPHATLYSALLREINDKGKDARFRKTERGKFAANK